MEERPPQNDNPKPDEPQVESQPPTETSTPKDSEAKRHRTGWMNRLFKGK